MSYNTYPCINNCTIIGCKSVDDNNRCVKCQDGAVLYDNSCLKSCPENTFSQINGIMGIYCYDLKSSSSSLSSFNTSNPVSYPSKTPENPIENENIYNNENNIYKIITFILIGILGSIIIIYIIFKLISCILKDRREAKLLKKEVLKLSSTRYKNEQ